MTYETNLAHANATHVLAFCKAHDWGRNARLQKCSEGYYVIYDLENNYTIDGVLYCETASIVATMRAAREFGNY